MGMLYITELDDLVRPTTPCVEQTVPFGSESAPFQEGTIAILLQADAICEIQIGWYRQRLAANELPPPIMVSTGNRVFVTNTLTWPTPVQQYKYPARARDRG